MFARAPAGLWTPGAPGGGEGEQSLGGYVEGLAALAGRRGAASSSGGQVWSAVRSASAAEALAERERRLRGHENVSRVRAVRAVAGGGVALYEEAHDFTLRDAVWFAPEAVGGPAALFALYQLLATLADAHDAGVTHGALVPELVGLHVFRAPEGGAHAAWVRLSGLGGWSAPSHRVSAQTWARMCGLWQARQISNLQYLLWCNEAAGRRAGDPAAHPVVPWVSDLSTRGGRLRDLTRSKFRLTKGDEQLDATYADGAPSGGHAAHHVPDTLSALAYLNYTARRAPLPLLQRFVRAHFQPGEYPASVQRLYEWSPDEAVPELYTDASIFRSRHPLMPDLGLPEWAADVEDFLAAHRALLESDAVSAQLHVWLDLTFGVLQRGAAAVAAKNVVLFRPHEPRNHGFLLLFPTPHPPRGPGPGAPAAAPEPPATATVWGLEPLAPPFTPTSPVAPPPPPRRPVLSALLDPLRLRRSLAPPAPPPVARTLSPPAPLPSPSALLAAPLPAAAATSLAAPPPPAPSGRFLDALLALEARPALDRPAAAAAATPAPQAGDEVRAVDALALAEVVERVYGTPPLAGPLQEASAPLPAPLAHLCRVLRASGVHAALAEPVFPAAFAPLLAFLRRFLGLADAAPRAELLRDALARAEAWPGPLVLPFVLPLFAPPPPAAPALLLALGACDWSGAPGGFWAAARPVLSEWYALPAARLHDELLAPAFLEAAWRLRLPAAPLFGAHLAALRAAAARSHVAALASLRWLHARCAPLLSSRLVAEPLATALSGAEGNAGAELLVWLAKELGDGLVAARLVPRLLRLVQEHASRAARTDHPLLCALLVLTQLADALLSPAAALRLLVPPRGQSSVLLSVLLNPPPHPPTLQALSALLVALVARAGAGAAAAVPYVAQFFAPYAALYDAQGKWRGKPDDARIYSPDMALLLWAPLAALVPGLAAAVPAAPLLDALARRAALAPPPPLSGLVAARPPAPLEPSAQSSARASLRQSFTAPLLPSAPTESSAMVADDEDEAVASAPANPWYAARGPDADGDDALEVRTVHSVRAHFTPLRAMLVHPDLERLVVSLAHKDAVMRLWSAGDARLLRSLTAHRTAVLGADWLDREGTQLGSCEAAEAALWDVETGRVIVRAEPPPADFVALAALNAPAAPAANHVLLLATADSGLHLWDVRSGDTQEWRLPTSGAAVRCLATEGESWVGAGLSSGVAVLLDLRTGCVAQQWRLSDAPVLRLAPRGRGALLASCAERSGVQLWSLSTPTAQLDRTYRGLAEAPAAFTLYAENVVCALGSRLAFAPLDAPPPLVNLTVRKLQSATPRPVTVSPPSITALAAMPLTGVCLVGTESGHIKYVV